MSVRPGTPADLPALRQLMQTKRRYLDGGLEDLPDLLARAVNWVGENDNGDLWGFVAFRIEPRSSALPAHTPERVTLRAAALVQTLFSGNRLPELLTASLGELQGLGRNLQISVLTNHVWLLSALRSVGFQEADQIRFYVRTQQETPTLFLSLDMRPLVEKDLDIVAQLDADTFDPLWHMGRSDLLQLWFSSRIQLAYQGDALIGYTATAVHTFADPQQAAEAQLVRLAVHPGYQGQGYGRQLLTESIAYAHSQGAYRIQLTTQESNKRSQQLYESCHFRRQGQNVPLFVYQLEAQ